MRTTPNVAVSAPDIFIICWFAGHKTECWQRYNSDCLYFWMQQVPNCPQCRQQIPTHFFPSKPPVADVTNINQDHTVSTSREGIPRAACFTRALAQCAAYRSISLMNATQGNPPFKSAHERVHTRSSATAPPVMPMEVLSASNEINTNTSFGTNIAEQPAVNPVVHKIPQNLSAGAEQNSRNSLSHGKE